MIVFLQGSSEKQDDLEQEKKKNNKAKEKTEETEDVSKEEEKEEEEKNKTMEADADPLDDDISSSDSQVIPQILWVEIKRWCHVNVWGDLRLLKSLYVFQFDNSSLPFVATGNIHSVWMLQQITFILHNLVQLFSFIVIWISSPPWELWLIMLYVFANETFAEVSEFWVLILVVLKCQVLLP